MEFYAGNGPISADQMWRKEMESVAPFCVGRGLDPGAGKRTFSPDVVRCDISAEHQPQHICDAIALPFDANDFDFVVTSHLLEHLLAPRAALTEWLRVVKPGGFVANIIPNTIFTRGQNQDPTPHLYEWSPRSFLIEVLNFPPATPNLWWEAAGAMQGWSEADLVKIGEACPRWSFCVVLRKT